VTPRRSQSLRARRVASTNDRATVRSTTAISPAVDVNEDSDDRVISGAGVGRAAVSHHDAGHRAAGQRSEGRGPPSGTLARTGLQPCASQLGGSHHKQGQEHGTGEGTVSPRSGDVLRVTRQASVQFTEPMMFRVIRVHDWQTLDGWAWLDGYELDSAGEAIERRSIFVELNGLQYPSHQ
jgi:hypothetical protein